MINIRSYIYNNAFLFSFLCWYRALLYYTGLSKLFLTKNKKIGIIILLLISPIFLIIESLYIVIYGRFKTRSINIKDMNSSYKYDLALVAIIKDEDAYIIEWIEYHLIIGINHFYIYDNGNSKETKRILKPYIDNNIVEYIPYPGLCMQCKAYTDAINKYKYICKYIGFIDIDEFILLRDEKKSLIDFINSSFKNYPFASGIGISWLNFGSNFHKKKPNGLVIENYLRRAPKSFMLNIKSIVNPRLVVNFSSPHYPNYKYGGYNVNEKGKKIFSSFDYNKSTDIVCINHYFTKSEEECRLKFEKGLATHKGKRSWSDFYFRDKNDEFDDTILRYLDELKSNINRRTKNDKV